MLDGGVSFLYIVECILNMSGDICTVEVLVEK